MSIKLEVRKERDGLSQASDANFAVLPKNTSY